MAARIVRRKALRGEARARLHPRPGAPTVTLSAMLLLLPFDPPPSRPDWTGVGIILAIVGGFLLANAILFRHPRTLGHPARTQYVHDRSFLSAVGLKPGQIDEVL